MSQTIPHITVCICTFNRVKLLGRLLDHLEQQRSDQQFTHSVAVVDNSPTESARSLVEERSNSSTLEIIYDTEPERNISLARNRTVRLSKGDFIAFIDDDEFPPQDWLITLYNEITKSGADAILAPVRPHITAEVPKWLIDSKLLDRAEFPTGTRLLNSKYTRTGNVLIKRDVFENPKDRFDPEYGVSGGGDAVFFRKAIEKGKIIQWCNEAIVYEEVPSDRCTASYYIKRAFTRGLTTAWETPFFSISTIKSIIAVLLYTIILPFSILVGRHLFMRILIKDCDHASKLLAYLGIKLTSERPYKASANSTDPAKQTA